MNVTIDTTENELVIRTADRFREIDNRAAEAKRAVGRCGDPTSLAARNAFLAIQGKAQLGLQDALANQPKLEAFDGLLAACEKCRDAIVEICDVTKWVAAGNPAREAWFGLRDAFGEAVPAIAKAKETTAPDAETPRAGPNLEISTD